MPTNRKISIANNISYLSYVILLTCFLHCLPLLKHHSMRIFAIGLIAFLFSLLAFFLFRRQSPQSTFWAGFAIGGTFLMLFIVPLDTEFAAHHPLFSLCWIFDPCYTRFFPETLLKRECVLEKRCLCSSCLADYFEEHKTRFCVAVHTATTLVAAILTGMGARLLMGGNRGIIDASP